MLNRSRLSPNESSLGVQMRLGIRLAVSVSLLLLLGAPCFGADSTPAQAKDRARVTIVYQDDAILPEEPGRNKKDQGLGRVRTNGGSNRPA